MKKTPNIQTLRLELIQWLSTIEDMDVLMKIVDLKNQENSDWWYGISDKEEESIELGLMDAEAKKLKPHSFVKNLFDKKSY
jgi:hypothetical protein